METSTLTAIGDKWRDQDAAGPGKTTTYDLNALYAALSYEGGHSYYRVPGVQCAKQTPYKDPPGGHGVGPPDLAANMCILNGSTSKPPGTDTTGTFSRSCASSSPPSASAHTSSIASRRTPRSTVTQLHHHAKSPWPVYDPNKPTDRPRSFSSLSRRRRRGARTPPAAWSSVASVSSPPPRRVASPPAIAPNYRSARSCSSGCPSSPSWLPAHSSSLRQPPYGTRNTTARSAN